MNNPYAVLQVDRSASVGVIEVVYRSLIEGIDPAMPSDEAARRRAELDFAWMILGDAGRRAALDASLMQTFTGAPRTEGPSGSSSASASATPAPASRQLSDILTRLERVPVWAWLALLLVGGVIADRISNDIADALGFSRWCTAVGLAGLAGGGLVGTGWFLFGPPESTANELFRIALEYGRRVVRDPSAFLHATFGRTGTLVVGTCASILLWWALTSLGHLPLAMLLDAAHRGHWSETNVGGVATFVLGLVAVMSMPASAVAARGSMRALFGQQDRAMADKFAKTLATIYVFGWRVGLHLYQRYWPSSHSNLTEIEVIVGCTFVGAFITWVMFEREPATTR